MRLRQPQVTPRCRRLIAIPALVAVLLAAVITTAHDDHGAVVSALPGAAGQPAPTGPTGGSSGGGVGGPPFRFSHRKCPVPRVVTTAARTLLPIRATVFRSTTVEPRKVREARASTTRPPATRSNCSRPTARNHPTMTPRCSPRNPNSRRASRRLPNNNSSSRPCSRNNSSHHSPTINEKPNANRSHKRWASLNRYSTWPVRAVHAQVDVFNLAETPLAKARGVLAPVLPTAVA